MKYLQDVPLPSMKGALVLLIGVNVPEVMDSYKVIPGDGDGPFAVHTEFGWVINGPFRPSDVDHTS